MLPSYIRNKVKELWNKFWSGGISNPLNAIEQITYLLFLKQLDENDKFRKKESLKSKIAFTSIFDGNLSVIKGKRKVNVTKSSLRWSEFTILSDEKMFDIVGKMVFPFIKQLNGVNSHFTKHMSNAHFLIPSARLLSEAVKKIDEIFIELEKQKQFIDAQGDFYEELLDELKTSGKNGQFRTPTHIIELIVELVQPELGQKIADPASGTAGFLLAAYKYIISNCSTKNFITDESGFKRSTTGDKLDLIKRNQLEESTFYGFDIDPTMIRIGLMNLMMHGITQPKIDYTDTLSKNYNEDDIYDTVLANPPFTGSIDKGDLNKTFITKTTKSELLFIERIYKMLVKGGTAGVIVPLGVLYGSGNAFKEIRKLIIEKCELKAVISLPSGVFKPYAGVSTAILIFTKGETTKDVWFYEMRSDGKTLDDKRTDLKLENGERDYGDLHEIIKEYRKKRKNLDRTKNHFLVPATEIKLKDYDLSQNKYKIQTYDDILFENPKNIISQLNNLEKEILLDIENLSKIF